MFLLTQKTCFDVFIIFITCCVVLILSTSAQERTYCIDHIKNHNALMMKEIFALRSSIMRRNAHLVDWLAEHFGAVEMQMVHKNPGARHRTPPVSTACTLPLVKGQLSFFSTYSYNEYSHFLLYVDCFVYIPAECTLVLLGMPATSPSTPHHPKLPYSRYSPNTASIGPAEGTCYTPSTPWFPPPPEYIVMRYVGGCALILCVLYFH